MADAFQTEAMHDSSSCGCRTATDYLRLSYQILDKLSDVEAISAEWDGLLERSACNRAFSSPGWYIAACRHNPALTPRLILARRGSDLVGLLPLALADAESVIRFPTHLSDYNDIVTASDDEAVAPDILQYALLSAGDYQLRLSNIRRDANCLRAAEMIWTALELERLFRVTSRCPYILLSASYEEYLASRSSKLRKNLGRALRAAKQNHIEARELEPESFSPGRLPEAFLSLQFARKGEESCFEPPGIQSFIREALPRLFAERRLRVFALFEKEKMIAIDLYIMGADSICSWNGGFGADGARWSPVKILNDAALRCAYALCLKEYDYLRGDHRYKLSWANRTREVGRLEINAVDYRRS